MSAFHRFGLGDRGGKSTSTEVAVRKHSLVSCVRTPCTLVSRMQRCSYSYSGGIKGPETLIDLWVPALDWIHPWKLGKYPALRAFMREMKANWTMNPALYDDYNLRAQLNPRDLACH